MYKVEDSLYSDSLGTEFHAWAQFFLVCVILPGDMHASPLIEAGCAGQVLRIDAQPNLVGTTPVELTEGMEQERHTQPPPSPRAPHCQCIHPPIASFVCTQ